MPVPRCRVCQSGFHEQRKVDVALLKGHTIDQVLKQYAYLGFSKSGLTRHRLHMDKVVRAPQRIDEERTAATVAVTLADTLVDLDRARADGIQHGRTAAVVRAAAEARAISKVLFTDLQFESTAVAEWLADIDVVWQGMRRLMRADPALALALAGAVEEKDHRMAKELREVHELLTTAEATKETAAA